MKNLIFVFVIIFAVFTSCKDDDGLDILIDGDDVVQVDDQDDTDDPDTDGDDNGTGNDDNDDGNDNGTGDDDNDNNTDDTDDNNENEVCFLIKNSLEGNGFNSGTAYERNSNGRITEIVSVHNGETTTEASINYRPDGTLRALVIQTASSTTNYHFDTDGLPVDGNRTLSDGTINTIHLELDGQDRIIKRVVREDGKDIAEFNFDYSADVIKKQFGYTTSSSTGIKINIERFYKYDFKSINPFSFDPYVAQLALRENVSPYMVSSISTGTGVQFEAEYKLDENALPIQGFYETPADGMMIENFVTECF